MKRLGLALVFGVALAGSAFAQGGKSAAMPPPPPPVATPAAPQVKALSIVQMQQLTIVQTQARAAAEELEKCRAQRRALTREFAWVLGVNPEFYEAELKALDDAGEQWGFVPKVKPAPGGSKQ